MKQETHQDMR